MKPKIKKPAKKNGYAKEVKEPKAEYVLGNGKHPKLKREDLEKIARKNVGGRDRFKHLTAYKHAIQDELTRLKSTNTNRDLLEDVGGELVESGRLGQPPVYRKEFADVARLICSLYGSSVNELAKFFNCDIHMITAWITMHPEFDRAVNERATEYNVQVMGRLARRALGFYAKTEKVFYDVKRGQVVKVPTTEYHPPSESAIFFWLKNRMPEHWKDVKDVNIDENRKIVLELYKNFDTMTQEQATDAYQELLKVEGSSGVQLHTPTKNQSKTEDRFKVKGTITDVPSED
jgi:hypothetical protein